MTPDQESVLIELLVWVHENHGNVPPVKVALSECHFLHCARGRGLLVDSVLDPWLEERSRNAL